MKRNMQIVIKNLHLSTIIGCYDYERDNTQPVILDLELNLGAWQYSDELENTVDYAKLCDQITTWVTTSEFFLLETLAQHLTQKLLTSYPQVKEVKISLTKPEVNRALGVNMAVKYRELRHYKVALALGSNLENPQQQLIIATRLLSEIISQVKVAPFYKTTPYGFKNQDDFYNTCISGYTTMEPEELLIALKKIEQSMGKVKLFDNGPRVIDIDIVFFEDLVFNQPMFLEIPHPRMHERDFVLVPLAGIEPTWIHPRLGLNTTQLLTKLGSNQQFILEEVKN